MDMLLDNIYVINLDRSTDRLTNLQNNFKEYNIKFTRFSAIEGKNVSNDQLIKTTSFLCRNFLCNYGIVGCALSHINLWKKLVLDQKTDFYVVMEDDAVINDNFKKTINEIDNIKYDIDFDIISLHCIREYNCRQYGKTKIKLSDGTVIGKTLFPLSTTSYILSKKGAIKLLSLFDKIYYHIDVEIAIKSKFNDINYYSLNKNLIDHNWEEASTVAVTNHKTIMLYTLDKLGLKEIYWVLNSPTFTIRMTYPINLYMVLLTFLLILNIVWFKNIFIYVFILIEYILYFSQM